MQALPFDFGSALARQHLEDLRREATVRRLVRSSRRRGAHRPEESPSRLRPAAASRGN